ncbi:MAG: hypothetical protein KatS3mg085_644 [Candidatus Dojkabacteria bacterium]|nr:MAG: hypothetical protein KatS3mg085_644 [Candidatus Dojkabacteria bacterium]
MNLEIKKYKTKNDVIQNATFALNEYFKANESNPILFLSSGGSCIEVLNSNLVALDSLTVGIIDERFTSNVSEQNFRKLINSEFIKINKNLRLLNQEINENEALEDYTQKFFAAISGWLSDNKKGKVVASLGMGADGHVAGIFPNKNIQLFNQRFINPAKLVVGYKLDKKDTVFLERVTVSLYFLEHFVDFAISVVMGENKKEVFLKLKEDVPINLMPYQIVKKIKKAKIFTDIYEE